jgi:mono/diheme cytochrome c family protein
MHRTHHGILLVPFLALTLVLAFALVGCGGDDETTTTAAPATETTAAAGGDIDAAAIFAANCATCHGAGGEGGVGPDLRGEDNTDRIVTQVTNGGGAMPAFGDKLSGDEISALADYVISLE